MTEPSETSSSSNSNDDKKRYPIDVRVFLFFLMGGMVASFGLGAFTSHLLLVDELAASILPPPVVKPKPSEWTIPEEIKTSTKRYPTVHSAELGPAMDSDGEPDHRPAGQHLMVDLKGVEAAFLNSETRLADAMVAAVKAGGLTLLSYHCHALQPAGVSCVGILLESHISFHTWPEEGVITLDLFTCGSAPLIPVVPILEELFGVTRYDAETGEALKVETLWSHELRGFRTREDRQAHYLDLQSDLALWITSPIDLYYKKQIVSVKSPYQQIDIWDALEVDDTPSYEDGLKHNLTEGDARWRTNELATPERYLFLDGTLQSLSGNEREYHEALVHPAMFAHTSPKKVAIVGGGEGGTLREILKHTSVESVTMIELDQVMIDIAKEHLPSMSDCSDLLFKGSTPEKNITYASCFDDPRTNLLIENGHKWFIENYGAEGGLSGDFDVIVIDALDPEEDESASEALYNDHDFLNALYKALTEDGVMVIQVGTAPNIHDPRADMGSFARRERMFQMLEAHPDTKSMLVYEEAHCGFLEPHSFLVLCKSIKCRQQWYAASDVVDYHIYERIARTTTGERALIHFDGSTQHGYKFPPKAWETVYCRREPTPVECAYIGIPKSAQLFDYDPADMEADSDFFIEYDENSDPPSYRVFSDSNIPKGSFIMPDHLAASFWISDRSLENLAASTRLDVKHKPVRIERFLKYIETHGHTSVIEGSGQNVVEIGGTVLIRRVSSVEEANVGRWGPPGPRPVYSPVYDRHRVSFDSFLVATRDIEEDEELLVYEHVWTT